MSITRSGVRAGARPASIGFALLLLGTSATLADHTVLLKSVLSGKCVEIAGASTTDGADAEQSTCDHGGNQIIRFTPAASTAGVFTLTFDHSGKCLEVAGESLSAGALLEQATCDGGANQQFELDPTSSGNYEIIARQSGLLVSLATASSSNGVKLQQHVDTNASRQRWRLANRENLDPSVHGQWSDVKPWPHIAVSAANLPNGQILTFSGSERETWPTDEFTYSAVWDPIAETFVEIDHATHNMFCAHLAMAADGQVFVNGGRNQTNSPWTSLFDYQNNRWVAIDNMATGGRWYPTTVSLADGDMFTAIGTATNQRNPERWDFKTGKWKVLTGIDFQTPVLSYTHGEREWWSLLHLAPQGKLFHSGPTPTVGWINTSGSGSYEDTGIRLQDWYHKHGTTVMYDEGKIVTAGGWINGSDVTSSNRAFTIDLNGPTPVVTNIPSMQYARKFHNGIMLPNGELLVMGGNTSGQKFSDSGAVHAVELWNPSTGLWRAGARETMPRNYHSIGLLLPDARVLSAGGGYCSGSTYCSGASHPDGEIYSPPYLFTSGGAPAARPSIDSGPGLIDNGTSFDLETTGSIDYFSMIKMSATTHGLNTDVRFLRVPSQDLGGGTYRLTARENPNVLTPGYWMIFAVDTSGVPSVAHIVRVANLDVQFDNLAELGAATQSSTLTSLFDLAASNAIDGDMTGTDESGSLTHTGLEANPWWELNLFSVFDIDSIRLWNRTDCCSSRLSDFYVLVSDDPFVSTDLAAARAQAGVSEYHIGAEVPGNLAIPIDRTGRFIRIQLAGTDYLSLAEVQVFGAAPGAGTPGIIHYDYYLGTFNAVPDFTTLTPERSGTVDGFQLDPATEPDHYAFRFYGKIAIPADGSYTFYTTSQDGSRLWIDGQLVVDNDGVHGPLEAQGSLSLTAGAHDILVGYFDRDGGGSLVVEYQGPGIARQSVPASIVSLLPAPGGFGIVQRDWWTGISGTAISALTGDPGYPDTPDGSDTRTLFEAPTNWADNYGTRMQGYLYPPFSGYYTFWIASDDNGELWLSTDEDPANRQRIAWVPGWSNSREWGKFAEQQSTPILLQSGLRYYVEARQKEGGGGDNLAVAWATPFAARAVIGGEFLSPPFEDLAILGVSAPPQEVTGPVSIIASAVGDGVEYSFSPGDGSPDTPFVPSNVLTHTYPGPGRYTVTLRVRDAWGQQESLVFQQLVHAQLTSARPNASSTIVYHDGRAEVWSVNPDNDSVAVIDANSNVRIAEIPVADEPRSLTVAVDGRVWVASKAASMLSVIDPTTQLVAATIPLARGSAPHGIVADPTIPEVHVALEATGELVKFHATTLVELDRIALGQKIRGLAISADGSLLLASVFVTPLVPGEDTGAPNVSVDGGLVLRVDPADLSLIGTSVLQHSNRLASEHSGPGLPNYVQTAVISPDGDNAWVPSKQDNILRGTLRSGYPLVHDQTVRAISSRLLLPGGAESFVSRIDHDNASVAGAAAFDPFGLHLFTTLEGNRQIAISDAYQGNELIRVAVGRAPIGVATSPTGGTLYVHNFMDRSVSVLDTSGILATGDLDVPTVATIAATSGEALPASVLAGKQLFYDASDPRLSLESYMACASCHNAAGQDGRTWDFTDKDEGLRNTTSLEGGGNGGGILHWSGNFDEFQDFENQIRAFAGGTGLMNDTDFAATQALLGPSKAGYSADLDALASYLLSLTAAPVSPHRDPSGNLTAQAESGRQLFRSLSCHSCHTGPAMTDSPTGARHDVGTIKPGSGDRMGGTLDGLDTPTLIGLWKTPSYLHDGSAATIAAAILAHTGNQSLPASQVDDLVAYLEQVEQGDPLDCVTDPDCDDGLHCNGAELCNAGYCESGAPIDCDDGVGCTTDSCDETGDACQNTPVDSVCDDGLFCNGAETCDLLADCQSGADPCSGAACDDALDVCVTQVPDEVLPVMVDKLGTDATIEWPVTNGAYSYNVYRGDLEALHVEGVARTSSMSLFSCGTNADADLDTLPDTVDAEMPAALRGYWYLITGKNVAGEGTLGTAGATPTRIHDAPCP